MLDTDDRATAMIEKEMDDEWLNIIENRATTKGRENEDLYWLKMEGNYERTISKRWLQVCLTLQILMIITVSVSFVKAPLIKFNNNIGYLTSLLFIVTDPNDTSDRHVYFYLEFMPWLKNN